MSKPRLIVLSGSVSRMAGGLFTSARRLALETARKYDTEVLSFKDIHTDSDLPEWNPLKVSIHNTTPPRYFRYSESFRNQLFKSDADIVHNHGLWLYPSLLLPSWSRARNRPYIVSPRGMIDPWAMRNSKMFKRLAMFMYEKRHLAKAACLHALNEAECRAIRAQGLRNPVCIIPNGIDLPKDSALEPRGTISKQIKTLIYIGRLHPKKNLINLIKAWELVTHSDNTRVSGWRLAIAGWDQDGYTQTLERQIAESGLRNKVELLGPVHGDTKAQTFLEADAFVMPSLSEGMPMSVLEAWGYGLPCVLTPHCNLPEGYEANAAIRTSIDPASIKNGILRLIYMSDNERLAMGRRGRELVKDKFQWSTIGDQMIQVYDWLTGKGNRPSSVV